MIEAISTYGVTLGGNIENEIAPCTEILSILESKHNIFSSYRVHLAYKNGSNFNFKVRDCRITFRLIFLIILKRAENLVENGNSFGFSLLKIMLQNILEKNYGGEFLLCAETTQKYNLREAEEVKRFGDKGAGEVHPTVLWRHSNC